jgi:hypothetical protein
MRKTLRKVALLGNLISHPITGNSQIRATSENPKRPTRIIFFIPARCVTYGNFSPLENTNFSHDSCNIEQG